MPGAISAWRLTVLALICAGLLLLSLCLGPVTLSPARVIRLLLSPPDTQDLWRRIIWDLRLPRAGLAMVCGAGLALSGVVLQSLTRNPLADPWMLGISSGAGLGAVVTLVAGADNLLTTLPPGAFTGGLCAFALVLLFAGRGGESRLILSGVAVTQLLSAFTSLLTFWQTDAMASRSIAFWLLGSFGQATWAQVTLCALTLAVVSTLCLALAPALNIMVMGATAAAGLGVNVAVIRLLLYIGVTLLTAVLVAFCGAIGFIGLTVPHLMRLFMGSRHQRLLPAAMLCGAALALMADSLARTLFAPRELPVGVITALAGAPVFLLALTRRG